VLYKMLKMYYNNMEGDPKNNDNNNNNITVVMIVMKVICNRHLGVDAHVPLLHDEYGTDGMAAEVCSEARRLRHQCVCNGDAGYRLSKHVVGLARRFGAIL
jgi:hypothetical protein